MIKTITFILLSLTFIPSYAGEFTGSLTLKHPSYFFGSSSEISGNIDVISDSLSINTFSIYGTAANATIIELLQPGTYTRDHTLASGATISRTGTIPAGNLGAYIVIESNSNSYQVYAAWTVSQDSKIFTNVRLAENTLIGGTLNGSVMSINYALPADAATVSVSIVDGSTHECSQVGGAMVSFNASSTLIGDIQVDRIDWDLDGTFFTSGVNVSKLISLGTHTVTATSTASNGTQDSDTVTVIVRDTTPPLLDILFVDELGNSVTSASAGDVKIEFNATDICDPAPIVTNGSAAPVMNTFDGDIISIDSQSGAVSLPTSAVRVTATARDISGRTSTSSSLLNFE